VTSSSSHDDEAVALAVVLQLLTPTPSSEVATETSRWRFSGRWFQPAR
jgi:hypothetical protein